MVLMQIKMLILSLMAVLRRALCCFTRRRSRSPSVTETLHTINVVANSNYGQQSRQQQYAERDWNSWDDKPRTVEEHIEEYRQRIAKPPTPQQEEPQPDFFSELAPVIKPQPTYYLGDDTKEQTNFSRLEAKTDVPIAINADLEDWEEEDAAGGWDELDAAQAKQMIREKRREIRSQRQQKTHRTNGFEANSRNA